MAVYISVAIGGLLIAWLLWKSFKPSLDQVVDQAIRGKDVEPILQSLDKKRESSKPAGFNHAIRRLWDSYQRELAIDLIKKLAEAYQSKPIAQYWLRQALTVEPKIAKNSFSETFLQTHYNPEMAQKCGNVG